MASGRHLDRGMPGARTCYPIQREEAVGRVYYIPEEGAVRGSDARADILEGAKNPVAANLFITTCSTPTSAPKNTNYIGYMGPNEAAKEFIKPESLERPCDQPDKAIVDKLQELLDLGRTSTSTERWLDCELDEICGQSRVLRGPELDRVGASGARPLAPARDRLAGALLPGPARDHLRRQPRARATRSARGLLEDRTLEQLRERAPDPTYLPTICNSIRYASITTILSIAIGYPSRTGSAATAGSARSLLLILVMLPFWTSYLIRTYAWMIILRDNGVVNWVLGARSDPRADHPPQHRHRGDPRHDLRLPAVRDPAALRVDRPAGRLARRGRAGPVRQRPLAFLHVTLPLTMPGIIAAALLTFIPAIGDYVTPDLLGGPQTTTMAKSSRRCSRGRDWPYGLGARSC